ncbi:death-associated protein-like 1 [Scleropages formosus]|uniref:Death-associated protein-like 1 n=1 Tax=Scleropages formosus TaxID=113540 RepID=A0A8C9T383_SCLFO|nr:death-associated protein-like 1 [Scleropages formosus]
MFQRVPMVQKSRSGARDRAARKAGHAPAAMTAGKRLAKRNPEETTTPSEKEPRRLVEKPRSLISTRVPSVSLLLSGTLEKLGHEFRAAPASDRHGGPRPAVEKAHAPRAFLIQQPRKF